MNEYLLIIHNSIRAKAALSADEQQRFLQMCEVYINDIQSSSQLLSAQPLARQGCMIARTSDGFVLSEYHDTDDILVGYYHIQAANFDDAIAIAQRNPEFAFVAGARIEVRPIKTEELSTNYVYPSHSSRA